MGLADLGSGDSDPDQNTTGNQREYVQPTKQEFEECLFNARQEAEWEIDEKAPGKEYVYDTHDFMPDHNGIVLRVYSTIDKRTGQARGKGADAIRLVIWNRHLMAPIGGRKKTLRIKTYCKNLTQKINELWEQWEQYVTRCEECGSWMVERSGQYGDFLGCVRYPDCKNTEDIND